MGNEYELWLDEIVLMLDRDRFQSKRIEKKNLGVLLIE